MTAHLGWLGNGTTPICRTAGQHLSTYSLERFDALPEHWRCKRCIRLRPEFVAAAEAKPYRPTTLAEKIAQFTPEEQPEIAAGLATLRATLPAPDKGEAVALQVRYKSPDGRWSEWRPTLLSVDHLQNRADLEYRELYARPAPPPQVDGLRAKVEALLQDWSERKYLEGLKAQGVADFQADELRALLAEAGADHVR